MGIKNAFFRDTKKNIFQRSKQLTMNSFLTFVSFDFCANLKSLHQDHLQSIHCYVRHLDEFVCGSGKKKQKETEREIAFSQFEINSFSEFTNVIQIPLHSC